MGEIKIVGPDKTRGYPYPVCKKINSFKSVRTYVCIGTGMHLQPDY